MRVTNSRILRIGAFVVPVLLLIGIISMRAISTDSTPQAETLARTAGLNFVTSAETHWNKGWTNISLTDARPVYDLAGDEIGYRFSVRSGSSVVGTIVVGDEDFSYRPFELVPVAHRGAPNATELATVIQRDLDRTTYTGQPTFSNKLLYLGYHRKFELYEIGGQEVAFHLDERMIMPKSELSSSLIVSKLDIDHNDSQSVASGTGLGFDAISTLTTDDDGEWIDWEKISGVPVYGQLSADEQYRPNNCGPTTGAMIVDYYRLEENFDDFDGWTENHDTLYDLMDTDDWCSPGPCPGTLSGRFANGFEEYADDKGYDFDASVDRRSSGNKKWNKVTDSIDDERPMGVMFSLTCSSAPTLHWNAIVGYGTWRDLNDNDFDYIFTNDPAGSSGHEALVSWWDNYGCTTLVDIEED